MALGSVGAILLAYACSSDSSSSSETQQACTPGQQISCGCPGGGQGVQVCRGDGSGYGSCQCSAGGGGGAGATGAQGGTSTTSSSGSGATAAGGSAQGGGGAGASGGGGGGTPACEGEPFPQGLVDQPACTGDATPCNAGGGDGTGTCISGYCWTNCTSTDCTDPYVCVTVGQANVCSVLTSCGSRCSVPRGVLCDSPAVCITISGDSYGMCLLECVGTDCPYEAGSFTLGCLFETTESWYCGFACDASSCPDEYTCETAQDPDRCEPLQT